MLELGRQEGLKHPWAVMPVWVRVPFPVLVKFKIMNRIEANNKLLEILKETLCKNPELRFIQALWNLKIIDDKIIEGNGHDIVVPVDRFYEEPAETLKRIGYEENS